MEAIEFSNQANIVHQNLKELLQCIKQQCNTYYIIVTIACNLKNSYKTNATTGCSDPKNLKQAPQLSRKKMKLSQRTGIAQID